MRTQTKSVFQPTMIMSSLSSALEPEAEPRNLSCLTG